MRKLSLLAAALCAAASFTTGASVASAAEGAFTPTFDFHGYFRSGVGVSKDGAEASWSKTYLGRLGNEDDTYGELEFGSTVYKLNDVSFYLDAMVSMVTDGSNDDENTNGTDASTGNGDANFGLRQFNLQIKGLIPGQKDAVVWAGKRYYQRGDIHVIDTKYINISGAGAGVEYLKMGPGALSLAWIRADSQNVDYRYDDGYDEDSYYAEQNAAKSTTNINFLDARYAGSYWNGGWLEFISTVAIPQDPDTVTEGGPNGPNGSAVDVSPSAVYDNGTSFMGTIVLSQDMFGGYNKTVVQYANNGLAHNMVDMGGGWYDSWNDADSASGFRIMNTGEIPVTDDFRFTHALTYGYASDIGATVDDEDLISAVARVTYQTTQYSRIMAELGAFSQTVNYTNGTDWEVAGQKYTLALAFAPGKEILSRPELRIYASYITSDGDTDVTNSLGQAIYDDNFNFGVQAEAWW